MLYFYINIQHSNNLLNSFTDMIFSGTKKLEKWGFRSI